MGGDLNKARSRKMQWLRREELSSLSPDLESRDGSSPPKKIPAVQISLTPFSVAKLTFFIVAMNSLM